MAKTSAHIEQLFEKYCRGTASESEQEELFRYLHEHDLNDIATNYIQSAWKAERPVHIFEPEELGTLADTVLSRIHSAPSQVRTTAVPRIPFWKHGWLRWAAVLLLVAGTATYLYRTNNTSQTAATQTNKHQQAVNIPPGGDKAMLTLSDGTTIVLDSATSGMIAQQGNSAVVKRANGQIAYEVQGVNSKEVVWNTVSTPKGGQYQVVLPDGTKAWLNASSAITFPAAFADGKRAVKIQGEVYLEVATITHQPFVVDVNGKSSVEVLGTSFNINSYADEASIKTTLLEGSLRVNSSVVLKPGQQAIQPVNTTTIASADRPLQITSHVNLEQILAWKNGTFDFTGADLKTVMRQLERWYDIKVQYKGAVSNIIFQGRMYRNVNLSDILEALRQMGVRFELNEKNLIIL